MNKFKTRMQIANELGISRKTLYNWLKKADLKLENRLLSPEEQRDIYKKFGLSEKDVHAGR